MAGNTGLVLVTGGAGFIGSHLVGRLSAEGIATRVLDNFSSGSRHNLDGPGAGVELIDGDVREPAVASVACAGVDVIVHLAAIASVQVSVEHPRDVLSVNSDGTLAMLEAARAAGVRRFVLASTAAVYGSAGDLPRRESMAPDPESVYGVSKVAAEHVVRVFGRMYGMETVILRYFNVFGPRQSPDSAYAGVLSRFARAIRAGEPVTVFGDGRQSRDFVYVANVVNATLIASRSPRAVGNTYNVGSGIETSLIDALERMMALAGNPVEVRHLPARPGDIRRSVADISSIRGIGYRVEVDFRSGCAALLAERP